MRPTLFTTRNSIRSGAPKTRSRSQARVLAGVAVNWLG